MPEPSKFDELSECYGYDSAICRDQGLPCAVRMIGRGENKCMSPYDPYASIMSAKYNPVGKSITLVCLMQFNDVADDVKILVNDVEQDTEISSTTFAGDIPAKTLTTRNFPDFPMGPRQGVYVQVQIKPFAGREFVTEKEWLYYNPTANNAMMRYMY
jgi:hypothetical protein